MTGVKVMQGTLSSQPAQDFAVDEGAESLAVSFTLKQSVAETMDQEGRDVYTCEYAISLAPAEGSTIAFDETEITLNAQFVSKQLKSAATGVTMQLNITTGETAVKIGFDGASRKKWEPEAIPQGTAIASFADEAIAQFLPGAAIRGLAVLSGFMAE